MGEIKRGNYRLNKQRYPKNYEERALTTLEVPPSSVPRIQAILLEVPPSSVPQIQAILLCYMQAILAFLCRAVERMTLIMYTLNTEMLNV